MGLINIFKRKKIEKSLIIQSYEDMSVNVFNEVRDILEDIELTEFEKKIKLLALFHNVSDDYIMELPINEVEKMVGVLSFLNKPPQKKTPPSSIVLNGKQYNIQYDIQNITASQYIDFQTFIKDYNKYMVELVSVVLIPDGKKYNDGYDIVEVQNDIREYMGIMDLWGICFFFVKTYQELMRSLTSYSLKQMKKMMRKEKDRAKRIRIARGIVQMRKVLEMIPTNG